MKKMNEIAINNNNYYLHTWHNPILVTFIYHANYCRVFKIMNTDDDCIRPDFHTANSKDFSLEFLRSGNFSVMGLPSSLI